jgi:membrane protein DedA with SNARE-associated domain
MSGTRFLILAGVAAASSVFLLVYGMWLWIIQTNGDAYEHAAGVMAVVAIILLIVGLVRSNGRNSR